MNIKEYKEGYIVKTVKKSKRVGRGPGSGKGKTCGRGTKGQKSRKSGLPRPGFEGGQTPLNQRISKWGFFHPKKEFDLVNLTQLEKDKKKSDNQVIDYSQKKKPVKILGNGELTESLENWTVRVAAISRPAQEKIEQVGGHVEIIKNEKSPKRAVK